MILGYNTLNQSPLIDKKEVLGDINATLTAQDLVDVGVITEISSLEDLNELLAGTESIVRAEISQPLTLSADDKVTIPAGKVAHINLANDITCAKTAFVVENGGSLVLSGTGTVKTTNRSNVGAIIQIDGKDAIATIDGVKLDAFSEYGKENNKTYAIMLMNDASLNFKSGTIETNVPCIGTNNLLQGATEINISGGKLLSHGSYAIYLSAQATINVSGGEVQGINARMGTINIFGDAKITPTGFDETNCDDIGDNITTVGCIWLGDTIAIVAGTYTDEDGIDCEVNVSGNARVDSSFRSAIGIYEVDTKVAQNVIVNVENPANVVTTAEGFTNIEVYDHEYIAAAAQAKGKTYNPAAQSVVTINQ